MLNDFFLGPFLHAFAFIFLCMVDLWDYMSLLLAFFIIRSFSCTQRVVLPRLKAWIRKVAVEDKEDRATKSLAEETAEAAKAAASAAAIVATASQELLNSKNEGNAT